MSYHDMYRQAQMPMTEQEKQQVIQESIKRGIPVGSVAPAAQAAVSAIPRMVQSAKAIRPLVGEKGQALFQSLRSPSTGTGVAKNFNASSNFLPELRTGAQNLYNSTAGAAQSALPRLIAKATGLAGLGAASINGMFRGDSAAPTQAPASATTSAPSPIKEAPFGTPEDDHSSHTPSVPESAPAPALEPPSLKGTPFDFRKALVGDYAPAETYTPEMMTKPATINHPSLTLRHAAPMMDVNQMLEKYQIGNMSSLGGLTAALGFGVGQAKGDRDRFARQQQENQALMQQEAEHNRQIADIEKTNIANDQTNQFHNTSSKNKALGDFATAKNTRGIHIGDAETRVNESNQRAAQEYANFNQKGEHERYKAAMEGYMLPSTMEHNKAQIRDLNATAGLHEAQTSALPDKVGAGKERTEQHLLETITKNIQEEKKTNPNLDYNTELIKRYKAGKMALEGWEYEPEVKEEKGSEGWLFGIGKKKGVKGKKERWIPPSKSALGTAPHQDANSYFN